MDAVSTPKAVFLGVRHGSVLGPILFLNLVNHVVSTLECIYKMFADDIKLHPSYSNALDNLEKSVQSAIDTLVSVSQSW